MSKIIPKLFDIHVNYDVLKQNVHNIKQQCSSQVEISSVVKADGYGLGIQNVVPYLIKAGIKTFFTATVSEALKVRECSDKVHIYVLSDLLDEHIDNYKDYNIYPVLNSPHDLNSWKQHGHKNGAAIHIDTGMNRLGLVEEEYSYLTKSIIQDCSVNLLMSHISNASNPHISKKQLDTFKFLTEPFKVRKSLAASEVIFLGKDYHFDLVRPGMGLLGTDPLSVPGSKQSYTLKVKIIKIYAIPKGTPIGYDSLYVSKTNKRIATVGIGFADGIPRAAFNDENANMYFEGEKLPVVGRISMDMITLDITHCKKDLKLGDMVEIVGENQTSSNWAEASQTIGDAVSIDLFNLSKRGYIKSN